jgi:hypothetical protein
MLTSNKTLINFRPMNSALAKHLSILVLSLLLGQPSLVFADHLHDNATEEINCELCGHIGAAAPAKRIYGAIAPPAPQKVTDTASFAPIKKQLFHRHPRGPPLPG